jgi:hypothetical protein
MAFRPEAFRRFAQFAGPGWEDQAGPEQQVQLIAVLTNPDQDKFTWVFIDGYKLMGIEGRYDESALMDPTGQSRSVTSDDDEPHMAITMEDPGGAEMREMTPEDEAEWERAWNGMASDGP